MKKSTLASFALLVILWLPTVLIAQPPTITSFTPTSGATGTTVTITGTGFNTTPANNIVIFGATPATVTAATSTQLTVTVPVGATYAPITVLNATTGLLAYSNSNFTPTFSPSKGSITASDFSPKVDFTT
ncbi:MAG: IPT/TIG domain-containing protein, partial [Cyclobacteriaceae bacterium]